MALDIGFYRVFIVIVTFLGVTALLITFFAADTRWFTTASGERLVTVPTEWNGINLRNMNLTFSWNQTLAATQTYPFTLGGHSMGFSNELGWGMKIYHYAGFGGQFIETLKWFNERSVERQFWWITDWEWGVKGDIIDWDYANFTRLQYTVKSTYPYQIMVLFYFNTTTYDVPSDAWNAGELQVFVGMNWEYMTTTMNAWDLISAMLFFKMSDTNVYVNAVFAIPLWAGIIAVSTLVVIEFIKAIKPFG